MDHYEAIFIGTLIACTLILGTMILAAGFEIAKGLRDLSDSVFEKNSPATFLSKKDQS